jgi:hypothetical protein
MAEILSQSEIDAILSSLMDEYGAFTFNPEFFFKGALNVDVEQRPYGAFEREPQIVRFRGYKGGDEILADIRQKNAEQGLGNYKVPNTTIELVNFSICPICKHVYTYQALLAYYSNPKPSNFYPNRLLQYRKDTSVVCTDCATPFLPSLVIIDGTPTGETQFLCRLQTVDAIEIDYKQRGREVLTRHRGNFYYEDGAVKGIYNDILISEIEHKPTLISNLLHYTPPLLAIGMMAGTNIQNKDLLFGYGGMKV